MHQIVRCGKTTTESQDLGFSYPETCQMNGKQIRVSDASREDLAPPSRRENIAIRVSLAAA